MPERPLIGVTPGDPSSAGPELLVRLLTDVDVRSRARLVAIGDRHIIARGEAAAGIDLKLADVGQPGEIGPHSLPHVDIDSIEPDDVVTGSADSARAYELMTRQGIELLETGGLDALLLGPPPLPPHAGVTPGWIARQCSPASKDEIRRYEILDGVWYASVLSDGAIADIEGALVQNAVEAALHGMFAALSGQGMLAPQLAMSRLNPPFQQAGDETVFAGREEKKVIDPVLRRLAADGLACAGPLPAATLFLRAREGAYDGVITIYPEQARTALALMGIERGIAVLTGLSGPVGAPAIAAEAADTAPLQALKAAFATLTAWHENRQKLDLGSGGPG